MRPIPERVLERAVSNVTPLDNGCIVSNYSVGSHGYAQIGWYEAGRIYMTLCHRAAWVNAHGPIVDDLTVDHLCRNRKCVNTEHLRLLTSSENGRANGMSIRTHCPMGHEYDEANTYYSKRGRQCRACRRRWRVPRAA